MDQWAGEDFEDNSQPMCAFDKQTLRFLLVNKAAVRYLGFSREEFQAMTFRDILSADEATSVCQTCVKAPSAQLPLRVGPLNLRKKDGTVIASEIHCQFIPYDGKDAIVMLIASPRRRGSAGASLPGS